MDELEKEAEESRAALKASRGWTNKWVDDVTKEFSKKIAYQTGYTPLATSTTTAATTIENSPIPTVRTSTTQRD